MPFTLAHPAAVLPFLTRRDPRGRWFDATCLVTGTMAPDFEYFVHTRMESHVSHTLAGLVVFDVPIALLLAAIFHGLVRAPLASALPHAVRTRFVTLLATPWRVTSPRALAIACASAFIGAATHLAWDGLTHRTGFIVAHLAQLETLVALPLFGDAPVYRVLQHASTAIGFALLARAIARLPRLDTRLPRLDTLSLPPIDRGARLAFVLAPVLCGVAFASVRLALEGGTWTRSYGHAIAAGVAGGCVGICVASALVWIASVNRRRASSPRGVVPRSTAHAPRPNAARRV